jgi:hypothetical protein
LHAVPGAFNIAFHVSQSQFVEDKAVNHVTEFAGKCSLESTTQLAAFVLGNCLKLFDCGFGPEISLDLGV